MADFSNSVPAPKLSIGDLEGPILLARNSAKLLEIALESILRSEHPKPTMPGGVELLLDPEEVEAVRHAMMNVLMEIRDAHQTWQAAFEQQREQG